LRAASSPPFHAIRSQVTRFDWTAKASDARILVLIVLRAVLPA